MIDPNLPLDHQGMFDPANDVPDDDELDAIADEDVDIDDDDNFQGGGFGDPFNVG